MAIASSRTRKAAPDRRRQDDAAMQRIITVARQHFFAHGFRGVTMDDLAGELGMSKKTLYASFPTKTDLLRAVLVDKFRTVEIDLQRITAGFSRDTLDSLHQLLACLQRHTAEIQPPFVRDIRREAPQMFELVQSRRRQLIQKYFGTLLDECRKAGIVRKDVSTRLIIEILLGATEAIMNPVRMAELDLTPSVGYSTIINVVFEGVLTEKGRKR
jgi:AcrR family transcriptional regulator